MSEPTAEDLRAQRDDAFLVYRRMKARLAVALRKNELLLAINRKLEARIANQRAELARRTQEELSA